MIQDKSHLHAHRHATWLLPSPAPASGFCLSSAGFLSASGPGQLLSLRPLAPVSTILQVLALKSSLSSESLPPSLDSAFPPPIQGCLVSLYKRLSCSWAASHLCSAPSVWTWCTVGCEEGRACHPSRAWDGCTSTSSNLHPDMLDMELRI